MRPHLATTDGTRKLSCWPAAVLVAVFDGDERLLLLSHPKRGGAWEVPSGAIEEGETVLAAALREAREELGPGLRLRPLGTAHAEMFPYRDPAIGDLLSVTYVVACDGGGVAPGDDMAGAAVRWATLDEVEREGLEVAVPAQPWLRRRALELFRAWRHAAPVALDWRPPS
jgi:8-oxo-dGTP diphosphatase